MVCEDRQQEQREQDIDISPLIDVVFILDFYGVDNFVKDAQLELERLLLKVQNQRIPNQFALVLIEVVIFIWEIPDTTVDATGEFERNSEVLLRAMYWLS